eukprot:scaffold2324_cov266-Pinguiococcus_pyrenoidosus.AAC.9
MAKLSIASPAPKPCLEYTRLRRRLRFGSVTDGRNADRRALGSWPCHTSNPVASPAHGRSRSAHTPTRSGVRRHSAAFRAARRAIALQQEAHLQRFGRGTQPPRGTRQLRWCGLCAPSELRRNPQGTPRPTRASRRESACCRSQRPDTGLSIKSPPWDASACDFPSPGREHATVQHATRVESKSAGK